MNDPTVQMMNQLQHQHLQPPPPSLQAAPPPHPMMNTVQNQPQQQMMMNQAATMPPQQGYGMWGPPPQMAQGAMDQMKFMNRSNRNMKPPLGGRGFQKQQGFKSLGPRNNWKGKRVRDGRRKGGVNMDMAGGSGVGGVGGYQPPNLNELQQLNRVKAKRFFSKKKYNPHYHTNYNSNNSGGRNMGNFAPRNTTSFLIRAKKSGGIAELVSPCPVTPAVLPTPMFSPSREVLVDTAKEEWGVDGYGSMKGLIRLRSPGREDEGDDDDDEGESSESDVEDHVEVERRLDHDLSRFEMIYPNNGGMDHDNVLENRVDDQDTHIAQLEEENLILKERLFLMQRELGDLRRRLRYLERHNYGGGEDIHEEVLESESDSETESHGESRSMGFNHEEFVEENTEGHIDIKMGEGLKGDNKVSKGNDENVIKKDNQVSESMDEEGATPKGLKTAADGSLGMSIKLESKNDTDNDEMPGVSHCNDENFTKKFDRTSVVLMNEMVGKDVPVKDNTDIENGREEQNIVKELGSTADAGSDILPLGGETMNKADNGTTPGDELKEASDE